MKTTIDCRSSWETVRHGDGKSSQMGCDFMFPPNIRKKTNKHTEGTPWSNATPFEQTMKCGPCRVDVEKALLQTL